MKLIKRILAGRVTKFIVLFCTLFGILYGLNYVIIVLTIPGGLYCRWIATHLDYVSLYRATLLKGASFFVNALGFKNHVDKYTLRIPGISVVRIVYSCLGFNLLCCWVAFTLSYPQHFKRKLQYTFSGIVIITVLNMIRIGGLGMIRSITYLKSAAIDHHLIFNIITYGIIFLMVRKMLQNGKPSFNNKLK
ncbi:MAG: exosortase/archaeosortase family protein [Flavipsychrobacter sp.]